MSSRLGRVLVCALALFVSACGARTDARSGRLYVAPGQNGDGSPERPFGRIQDAIAAAQPGDVVVVRPGRYDESLVTVRDATADAPITVKGEGGRQAVTVTAVGLVLSVQHPHHLFEGLTLDGQFGPRDVVQIEATANSTTLRALEVRNSSRECVDMSTPDDVLIDRLLIHHCLNPQNGRRDAHGIAAGGGGGRLENLTVRDTEIHTFSGDAIQIDPTRSEQGWDNVLIERCKFWLKPLETEQNGFKAGVVPGENALDTKINRRAERARIVVRDTEAWGFRGGLINNMAAFNLKEKIDALIDGVTVWDSQVAFRLRGRSRGSMSRVTVQNSVVHHVAVAIRYEDNPQDIHVWNSTFGRGVTVAFHGASARRSKLDIRNVLFLGRGVPRGPARGTNNKAVGKTAFVDADRDDYTLAPRSPAIDAADAIQEVSTDRAGTARPQGIAPDLGAYEAVQREPPRP